MKTIFQSRRPFAILAAVFLLALVPRVVIVLVSPHMPYRHWDVTHDVVIARNLASGNGFANEPGHPTAFRYPLVPFVLSLFFRLFGERYIPFLLFQALLGSLTAVMISMMALKASGEKLALLAGFLTAVNPELVSFTRMMLTETIFAFLLAALGILFILILKHGKTGHCIAAGLITGVAALCRPVAVFWAVLMVPVLIRFWSRRGMVRKGIAAVLIIASISLAAVSLWIVRNQVTMGAPVFNTAGGVTFWLWGHNDAEPSDEWTEIPEEYEAANRASNLRVFFTTGEGDPADIVPVFNMQPRYQAFSFQQRVVDRLRGLDEIEADRELNSMALEYVFSHPIATLRYSLSSLFKTFAWTEMNGRVNIVLALAMPFLLLGSFRLAGRSGETAAVVLSCIVSMLLVHVVFYFDHRFRVPYQPFLMLLAASGILRAWEGNLSLREKLSFFGFMILPVVVNYFLVWGDTSG